LKEWKAEAGILTRGAKIYVMPTVTEQFAEAAEDAPPYVPQTGNDTKEMNK